MRNLNFCPDGRFVNSLAFRIALGCFSCLLADSAYAIDPNWMMSQYVQDHWGPDQGFPRGQVRAITQTPDGYLWIGSEAGLLRFDGLKFQLVQDDTGAFSVTNVLALEPDREGSLWLRLEGGDGVSLLRYRNGVFDNPSSHVSWPNTRITAICKTSQGEIMAAQQQQGAIVFRDGKFEMSATAAALPRSPVLSIAQTRGNEIWIGTRDAGLFRLRGERSFAVTKGIPDPKINRLLRDGDNGLWIGTDNGIVRWDGLGITTPPMPPSLSHFQALAVARDRDKNLWVGTDSVGLLRINAHGVAALGERDSRSAEPVTAVFEDREGNIWAGGANGLRRWRDSAFVTFSVAEGMPAPSSGPIVVDSRGRLWFAPIDGGLYWLEGAQVQQFSAAGLPHDVVYSIAGAPDGLWIGRRRGGLTHLRFVGASTKTETLTKADGLAQDSIYSVYRDRDGTVWAGTLSGGVSRIHDGRIITYTTANGLASNMVSSIAGTSSGAEWFATPNGLSAFSQGRWRGYSIREGLPSRNVNCLFADSAGILWIGTTSGLAFLDSRGIRNFLPGPKLLRESILGLAEDGNGSLWIATSNHVLRANRKQLLGNAPASADVREYGKEDGLQSTQGVKRHSSVSADSVGRVWFSLRRGLSVVDPSRDTNRSVPVIAQVQSIAADGTTFDLRHRVLIPPGRRRIAFSYTGLGLSTPGRVQFRYLLDGYDSHWSDPVSVREAAYTNLGPRTYVFRVIASNGDGLWSSPEAAIQFEIQRSFWETYWFRVALALACAAIVVLAYRLRLRQLTNQLNVRFEERLAERSRIAQELHDTLLQGLLSASMQLHVASDELPVDSPTQPRLNRVLELMGQVVQEGRNAVRGLRSFSDSSLDLEQALSRIPEELAIGGKIDFRVVVGGQPRPLRPLLRDETYRIGREALVNAIRHSHATRIEAEVEYSTHQLRVVITDNGCGIDPLVLQSGREGHWGLPGMRERAESIGAQLHVRSRASAGTEVELLVPGRVAFQSQSSSVTWRARLRLRSARRSSVALRTGSKDEQSDSD